MKSYCAVALVIGSGSVLLTPTPAWAQLAGFALYEVGAATTDPEIPRGTAKSHSENSQRS